MTKAPTGAESVRWDLGGLYAGIADPALARDIEFVEQKAKVFRSAYQGKLATLLGAAISDYAALRSRMHKVIYYLSLRQSVALDDEAVKTALDEAERRITIAAGENLTFFHLEIVALDEAALAALMDDEIVAKHKPWIAQVRLLKPHLFSEPVEAALAKRKPFGPDSWAQFFDEVEADLRFEINGEKKIIAEITDMASYDRDPSVRAAALKSLNDGLSGGFLKYSAQTLNMVVGDKRLEDKERGYGHPMAAVNLDNMIPDKVVESLHEAVVRGAAPLARRWYSLKAKLLGMDRLRWSDRNAKLPFVATASVPWPEAVDIVTAAYRSFSPTLEGLVRRLIDARAIDAPAVPGKHSGAFNSSCVLPDGTTASYTLLNYLGTLDDVATLAHELGHAVHFLLAGEAQGPLMFGTPTPYAETASVFGEMVTFDFLRKRFMDANDDRQLLGLVGGKIDDVLNTVLRQISFSNFERKVHGSGQRLSPAELDRIWMAVTEELYGAPGDVFTYENTEHLWSYISHFHSPFYVHSYAFGELLTQSLYAARPRLGASFEPLYLDLLRSGGTRGVADLLSPFGLDPADPAFWEGGIDVALGSMVELAESLAARIAK